MHTPVDIISPDGLVVQLTAKLDTGAEATVISYAQALLLDLKRADDIYPLVMETFNQREAYYYSVFHLYYKLTDSLHRTKTMNDIIFAVDRDKPDPLFGMPLLDKHNIILDPRSNKWYFGDSIEIVPAKAPRDSISILLVNGVVN